MGKTRFNPYRKIAISTLFQATSRVPISKQKKRGAEHDTDLDPLSNMLKDLGSIPALEERKESTWSKTPS